MLRFVQTRDGERSQIITGLQATQWLPAMNWDINVRASYNTFAMCGLPDSLCIKVVAY